MSLRTHSFTYLYIGIALMLATCISCVTGLSDNRSGHSSTSREVVTPHSTNPKISRTMLCRGIATKKKKYNEFTASHLNYIHLYFGTEK